jgi:hypothetical protein
MWSACRDAEARAARIAAALFGIPVLIGWFIPACSTKHQVPGFPAYAFLAAAGVAATRGRLLRGALWGAILVLDAASLANYFRNQQYTDIDIVIPWREMAAAVEQQAKPCDGIILGYNPEPFRWYYRGTLPVYEFGEADFMDRAKLARLLRQHGRLWVLMFKDDPRDAMENWMRTEGRVVLERPYQYEEETLRGLRESWRNVHKYRSYYYKLYCVEAR